MKFLVNGTEVEFAESLTLGEARTLKRVSGFRLDEIDNVMGDPDVLVAFVLISAQRVFPDITEADVEAFDLSTIVVEEPEDSDEAGEIAPLGEPASLERSGRKPAKRAAKAS